MPAFKIDLIFKMASPGTGLNQPRKKAALNLRRFLLNLLARCTTPYYYYIKSAYCSPIDGSPNSDQLIEVAGLFSACLAGLNYWPDPRARTRR